MSWGRDLFDQGDAISIHTKKGIEFLDRYSSFILERHKLENDYARQLKTLVSKYMPKKREEEDEQFTYCQAFVGALNELGALANQHERVAEQFQDEIAAEISTIAKKLREERKQNLDEALHLQDQLKIATETLSRARKDYGRAHKESEAALAKYQKAEADLNLSRAEVEKAKNNCIAKTHQAEDAKNNYALQLQRTNEFQREYYTRLLPSVFEKLRELDENRINNISRLMAKCVEIEKNVLPIVQRCLDGMLEHSKRIDASVDSLSVVQRYGTGYAIPQDLPFEDLSVDGSSSGSAGCDGPGTVNGGSVTNGNGSHYGSTGTSISPASDTVRRPQDRKQSGSGTMINRAQSTKRGKLSNFFKSKGDDYLKEDFSDLPPQQQCQRLKKRIDNIQKQIDTKLAQKDGLMRMQSVYRESPKLGDLSKVEMELRSCEAEVASLEGELAKFQNYLKEASTHLNVPINLASSNSTSPSSTPRSSMRAPPPNRPPPPTASPSFQGNLPSNKQRNSGGFEPNPVGRSGSEHAIMAGNSLQDNAKAKSHTPTPPPANTNGNAMASLSSTPPRVTPILTHKNSNRPPSSTDSGYSSKSASRLAPAAPVDDYDEWLPADADECESRGAASSASTIILGTCRALYDFSGDGEGMVAMKEGEEMLLLERDAGDGWTKIRKENLGEGFVPTSYLDCKWYPD